MREIAIAIVSACVAGAGAGKALFIGSDPADPSPEPTALLSEDPGLALHRAVMGADPWTAPPPVIRVAAARAEPVSTLDFQDVAFHDDTADLTPAPVDRYVLSPAPAPIVRAADHPVQIAQAPAAPQRLAAAVVPQVTITDAAESAPAQEDRPVVADTSSDSPAT